MDPFSSRNLLGRNRTDTEETFQRRSSTPTSSYRNKRYNQRLRGTCRRPVMVGGKNKIIMDCQSCTDCVTYWNIYEKIFRDFCNHAKNIFTTTSFNAVPWGIVLIGFNSRSDVHTVVLRSPFYFFIYRWLYNTIWVKTLYVPVFKKAINWRVFVVGAVLV